MEEVRRRGEKIGNPSPVVSYDESEDFSGKAWMR